MGIINRITRVFKSNINDIIDKAEDPEKVLEQTIREMSDNLIKIRQATAQAIASKKTLEKQYEQNLQEAELWQTRAKVALANNNEELAKEALFHKSKNMDNALNLKNSINTQDAQISQMTDNLRVLESKIAEAKTKKDMLKARVKAAEAQRQLQNVMGSVNNNSAFDAFDRMENKVIQMEAMTQAIPELEALSNSKWSELDSANNNSVIEAELEALRSEIQQPKQLNHNSVDLDKELDNLRNSIS